MTLDLQIVVRERESGVETENFTLLSITGKELGNVNFLIDALKDGVDLTN